MAVNACVAPIANAVGAGKVIGEQSKGRARNDGAPEVAGEDARQLPARR